MQDRLEKLSRELYYFRIWEITTNLKVSLFKKLIRDCLRLLIGEWSSGKNKTVIDYTIMQEDLAKKRIGPRHAKGFLMA